MKQCFIKAKRKIKNCLPKGFDINTVQIGIPVLGDEANKVGLLKEGDIILPSSRFGKQCERNAYGYSYADKTKPKENRYVSTIWMKPYGNENADEIAVDISKKCWQRVFVSPYGVELELIKNVEGQRFIVAILTEQIRKKYFKEAVNVFLEIYGVCYFFDGDIKIDESVPRQRCNWEILPPGEKPSVYVEKRSRSEGENANKYDIYRLEYFEKYKSEKIVVGINGFYGYCAYVFADCCVLESAAYGNATYIIPKENWEVLSQKTKEELFREDKVIAKAIHNANWQRNIEKELKKLRVD